MHIVISTDGTVSLDAPNEFTAFDVRADDAPSALAALGPNGAPCADEGHVFVGVGFVRELAGDAATETWDESYESMLGYATSKGWMNDDATMIKAHITT